MKYCNGGNLTKFHEKPLPVLLLVLRLKEQITALRFFCYKTDTTIIDKEK
jgi:hypothetical protein